MGAESRADKVASLVWGSYWGLDPYGRRMSLCTRGE